MDEQPPSQVRKRRWLALLPIVFLLACCPGPQWAQIAYHAWRFRPSLVVGMSPQDVQDAFGKPLYAAVTPPPESSELATDEHAITMILAGSDGAWIYPGWFWQRYVIEFKSGVAVRSFDSGK